MVQVMAKDGALLLPTGRYGKVRHLLEQGKAVIVSRNPFTIQLKYDTANDITESTTGNA